MTQLCDMSVCPSYHSCMHYMCNYTPREEMLQFCSMANIKFDHEKNKKILDMVIKGEIALDLT